MASARVLFVVVVLATALASIAPHVTTPAALDVYGTPVVIGSLHENGAVPIFVYLQALNENTELMRSQMSLYADSMTFVLPVPPLRMLASRNGLKQRAWYDVRPGYYRRPESLLGFDESARHVAGVVSQMLARNRPVFVTGFGQGGALAFALGYSDKYSRLLPRLVNGVAMFGAYVATEPFSAQALRDVPLRWAHSPADKQLSYVAARFQFDELMRGKQLTNAAFMQLSRSDPRDHAIYAEALDILIEFSGVTQPNQRFAQFD